LLNLNYYFRVNSKEKQEDDITMIIILYVNYLYIDYFATNYLHVNKNNV